MIIVAGRLTLDPTAIPNLATQLGSMRDASLQEEGCADYAIFVDDPKVGTVFVFEAWRDRESQERHLEMPMAQEFMRQFASHILGSELKIYEASLA